jgi:hypothetical protein
MENVGTSATFANFRQAGTKLATGDLMPSTTQEWW